MGEGPEGSGEGALSQGSSYATLSHSYAHVCVRARTANMLTALTVARDLSKMHDDPLFMACHVDKMNKYIYIEREIHIINLHEKP